MDPASEDLIVLYVSPGTPGDGALDLRMSSAVADEARRLLDGHGLEHSAKLEFSANAGLVVEAVQVIGSAGAGLAGLAQVIKAIAHRNDGKKVVIDREGTRYVGYSDEGVERLIDRQEKRRESRDGEWRRIKGTPPPEQSDLDDK